MVRGHPRTVRRGFAPLAPSACEEQPLSSPLASRNLFAAKDSRQLPDASTFAYASAFRARRLNDPLAFSPCRALVVCLSPHLRRKLAWSVSTGSLRNVPSNKMHFGTCPRHVGLRKGTRGGQESGHVLVISPCPPSPCRSAVFPPLTPDLRIPPPFFSAALRIIPANWLGGFSAALPRSCPQDERART